MERKRKNGFFVIVYVGISFFLMALGGCTIDDNMINKGNVEPTKNEIFLSIACVGDVMAHGPQIRAQYDSVLGNYNFDNNFKYIKKYIERADLALFNLETTFGGEPYSSYPQFCAPDQLATALFNTGFDVAFTSNNHLLDTGAKGVKRTIDVLREAGLTVTGTHHKDEKNYVILEKNGISVAMIAFTYETHKINGRNTINTIYIPEEMKSCINSFGYETLDEDLDKMTETIKAAKEDGAEIVVFYLHCGEEYQRTPNKYQKEISKRLAEEGADIIFSSHPHVLQTAEILLLESGRKVPVFYSLGNFISNQREEILKKRYTEQGGIAFVNLKYSKESKKITEIDMNILPTWVDKYINNGKTIFEIIPLDNDLDENPSLKLSRHISRAKIALDDCIELFGEAMILKE